jgi:hypothetical protein
MHTTRKLEMQIRPRAPRNFGSFFSPAKFMTSRWTAAAALFVLKQRDYKSSSFRLYCLVSTTKKKPRPPARSFSTKLTAVARDFAQLSSIIQQHQH